MGSLGIVAGERHPSIAMGHGYFQAYLKGSRATTVSRASHTSADRQSAVFERVSSDDDDDDDDEGEDEDEDEDEDDEDDDDDDDHDVHSSRRRRMVRTARVMVMVRVRRTATTR